MEHYKVYILNGIDVFELIKRIKEILKESNKRENVESDKQFNDYVRDKIEEAEKSGFVEPETINEKNKQ